MLVENSVELRILIAPRGEKGDENLTATYMFQDQSEKIRKSPCSIAPLYFMLHEQIILFYAVTTWL